ncbi:hypothetical protein GCM10028812_01060 [Ancylobacter sonchi]|uniref:hypothetical protein n=1 Tax=Ancylobacter sonchi TaxID=1937790 RepID=UPI001FE4579C|nr:hypothetical protein [Ancylobacter sonchi]
MLVDGRHPMGQTSSDPKTTPVKAFNGASLLSARMRCRRGAARVGYQLDLFQPPVVIEPGERTGTFRLGADDAVRDAEGRNHISFEDHAVALVDELERPRHERTRFTIGY